MTTYIKSVSVDFPSGLNISDLTQDIVNETLITIRLIGIKVSGDEVDIIFESALSPSEIITLDTVISNYVFVNKVTLENNKYITTVNPTPTDDNIHGFYTGVTWINKTTKEVFVLNDGTTNTAVWKNTSNKGYDATVDSSGNGDYTSVVTAFASGAVTVFIRAGFYVESSDIIVPDGGVIHGEGPARSIICFTGPCGIKVDATDGVKETAGTISIVSNTTAVIGTGTTFTNLSAGQFILLGQTFYSILSITNDTNLTINDNYKGKDLVNVTYQANSLYSGIKMQNFIIMNSSTVGLFVRGARHSIFSSIAATGCGTSFRFEDCSSNNNENMASQDTTGDGIVIHDCYAIGFENVTSFNSDQDGFSIEGTSNCILISNCQASNNKGIGFNIDDSTSESSMTVCISKQNDSHGVYVSTTARKCNLNNNIISDNGGNGVHLVGLSNNIDGNTVSNNTLNGVYTSDNNIISGNFIYDNLETGIIINGNTCQIDANNIHNNGQHGISGSGIKNGMIGNSIHDNGSDGICINGGNQTSMNGNRISDNTGKGVNILGLASQILVTNNIVSGNTYGIDIGATGSSCIVTNNIVSSSSFDGIRCGADYCVISANRTLGNTGYGVHITSDSNSTLSIGNHNAGNVAGPELDNGIFPVLNPIKGIYLAKSDSINVNGSTSNNTYIGISNFIYAGSFNNHSPVSYKVSSYMDSGATDYSIRVYDLTNNLTLAQVTVSNTSLSIVDLGAITNIPTTDAILEVQMKINNISTEKCYVNSLLVKYY